MEEALKWLRISAAQGHCSALSALGSCYLFGEGVPEDRTEAMVWIQKGAEKGDSWAQYTLGGHYARGLEVAKDLQQAVVWYGKSAAQGYAHAQFYLGKCYRYGEGVGEDKVMAHHWWDLASDCGVEKVAKRAHEERDEVALFMTEDEIADARRLTTQFLQNQGKRT